MDRKHIARYANASILMLIAGWLLYTYAEMPRAGGAIMVIGFFGLAMHDGTLVRMSL